MTQRARRFANLFGFSLCSLAFIAGAQTSNNAPADPGKRIDQSGQLDEVVVTAEKRTERLQDTPISVSALTGAELQQQGITDTADAAREIPGIALTSGGPGQTEYTIRGLSSSGPAVATVGFYLDDVPVASPSGAQNGHVSIDPDLTISIGSRYCAVRRALCMGRARWVALSNW